MRSPLTTRRLRPLTRGREVGRPRSRVFMWVLGLLGIGFALMLLWVGFNAANTIPGRSYYYVKAEFREADNLADTYQARAGAKLIGQVSDTEARDGKAVVELQLDGSERPLLSDTRLEVRPRSPIGVRYVDVKPGHHGRPLEEGEVIPASQTSATVPLDGALETFDGRTRPKARALLRELGAGFAGRGDDGNQTLAGAPELLRSTEDVAGAINELDGAMGRFIRSTEGAAAAADPVRSQIAEGFDPGARALRPFSDEGDSLRETLDQAPPTLATTRSRLPRTRSLVVETGGLARSAEPALERAPGALRETTALLHEARPGLRQLDRTLALAKRATAPTLGLLDAVRPVLPHADSALTDSLPILRVLAPRGCDYDRMWRNWESMLGFEDGKIGMLRFEVIATDESLEGGRSDVTPIFDNAYPEPCEAGTERTP